MTTSKIDAGIYAALCNLELTNQMVFDYWVTELFDDEVKDIIEDNWNEVTLLEMNRDVMINSRN